MSYTTHAIISHQGPRNEDSTPTPTTARPQLPTSHHTFGTRQEAETFQSTCNGTTRMFTYIDRFVVTVTR